MATAGIGEIVQLWDATNGKLVREYYSGPNLILSLAFSPDGNRLSASGANGVVLVWEVGRP